MPEQEKAAVLTALREIPAVFGRPHVHSGTGMRQLRPGLYESRIGLELRAIFVREGDTLVITMLGTHDEVRHYLREQT
jgi:hypothetical protein